MPENYSVWKGIDMTKPVIAQNEPIGIDVIEGTEYWWCACGESQAQPFCDGSHKGKGISPTQFVAKRTQTVWFCGCKQTANAPTCDGTHNDLQT